MKIHTPRITKKSEQIFQWWMNFWQKKGSLFLEDYTLPFISAVSNNRTNIFFSINWYKPLSKNRKEQNIESFNCFYFDIDQKDNPDISKILLQVKILSYSAFFDFIVESRNGYHLYMLLPEGKYTSKEEYLVDWKQKAEELESIMDICLDKNVFDTTRISRVPWSFHQKVGDTDYFTLKLMKWEEILFPQYEKLNQINTIPITEVLDVLGVEYRGNTIYDSEWLPTSGYKINLDENYIIDFSHSRPEGEPFAFVKGYFTQKIMKDSGKKDEWLAMWMTYNFFRDHFWIIGGIESSKKIIIKAYIEKYIYEEHDSREQYIIYAIMAYYQKTYSGGIIFWRELNINVAAMIQNLWLSMSVKDVVAVIGDIIKKQKTVLSSENIFFTGKTYKTQKKWFFEGIILPDWNKIRNRREFYITHYIPFSIFQLNYKNSDFSFYLFLSIALLNQKNLPDLAISKSFVAQWLLQDNNFSRVFRRIQNIREIMKNFHLRKTQKEIMFLKN